VLIRALTRSSSSSPRRVRAGTERPLADERHSSSPAGVGDARLSIGTLVIMPLLGPAARAAERAGIHRRAADPRLAVAHPSEGCDPLLLRLSPVNGPDRVLPESRGRPPAANPFADRIEDHSLAHRSERLCKMRDDAPRTNRGTAGSGSGRSGFGLQVGARDHGRHGRGRKANPASPRLPLTPRTRRPSGSPSRSWESG
jgi:hypothetical protein